MIYHAVIALGSNLDTPVAQLRTALAALAQLPGVMVDACSPAYQNPPIGPEQPPYVNAVCTIRTHYNPWQLLRLLQAQEHAQQRVKTEHWGARTIDLDIVAFDGVSVDSEHLHIPHRFAKERRFVLQPWLDIAPDAELTVAGASVPIATLLAQCPLHEMKKLNEPLV